jgi:hypothetical protein
MTHAQINRRRALAVVAAVPAAAALGGAATSASGEPSQLAALVRRYWAEIIDAFNVSGFNPVTGQYRSDKKSDALAAATFEKTMLEMVGVPARTREDALAALDWLIKDGADLDELNQGDWNQFSKVAGSLVDAIRGYIEGRVS